MNKVHLNGTADGIYLEARARFPSGDKVWPAIWLVTEVEHWPPEFCLVLNNAVMAAPPDQNTTWPNYLIIDYVALYQQAGG